MARPIIIRPRQGWVNNRAVLFDGATSYGEAVNTSLPTAAASLSAWVRVDAALAYAPSANLINTSTSTGMLFTKAGTSNVFGVRFNFSTSGSTPHFLTAVNPIVVGTWYHLLGTFDGTNFRTYLNGVLSQTTNRAGQTIVITGTYRFARYTPCTIDEVSWWNRAVAVNEVASSNLPIDIRGASGLVRYYRMGELYTPGSFVIPCQAGSGYNITWINGNENTQLVAGAV